MTPGEGSLLGPVSASTALANERQYAIRKRFLVPGWWLLGYVAQSLSSDLSLLPAQVVSRELLFGADIPPRHFHLICSVWTEILKLVAGGRGLQRRIDVRVDGFLRGTSSEITQQLELLESYWAQPFRKSHLTGAGAKRRRGGRASPGSQVNFVRSCSVARGEEVVLSIELGCTLEQFWCGNHMADHRAQGEVVSVNPDVMMAYGTGKSMKKLCSYLLVEFAKRFPLAPEGDGAGWFGGLFDGQSLWTYHKDLRSRTNSLYEHGVLGWEESAPRVRIRDMRSRLVHGRSVGAAADGPSVLHLIRVSQLSLRAAAIEETVQQSLVSAKAVDVTNSLAPAPVTQPLPEVSEVLFPVSGAVERRRAETPRPPVEPLPHAIVAEKHAMPLGRTESVAQHVTEPVARAVTPLKRVVAPAGVASRTTVAEPLLVRSNASCEISHLRVAGEADGARRPVLDPAPVSRTPPEAVATPSEPEVRSNAPESLDVRFANFYFDLDPRQKEAVNQLLPHMSKQQIMDVMSCFEKNARPPRRRRQ